MVTARNKEVLSGTDAVEISCEVTGLTAQLQTVKWKKSDGTDVTTGVAGYTSEPGTFGGGSQITTLTVASAQNSADSTYSCVITPAPPDDATEISTPVKLNVFSELIIEVFVKKPHSNDIVAGSSFPILQKICH